MRGLIGYRHLTITNKYQLAVRVEGFEPTTFRPIRPDALAAELHPPKPPTPHLRTVMSRVNSKRPTHRLRTLLGSGGVRAAGVPL